MKLDLITMLKGGAMGVAEIIPGVSGGTIAFITGIYERLLDAVKSFDIELIRDLFRGNFKAAWTKIDGWFLTSLITGMAAGIVIGVFVIDFLIKNYPEPLWGFFFGLIVASAVFIGRMVGKWDFSKILVLMAGFLIAFGITLISPAEGSLSPFYIFICGVIAISALILPGISGSFMLLLMGMYTVIIPALKHLMQHRDWDSFVIISIFAVGCLVGLTGFSRVMSWLFKNYKETTFVLLTGFLLGSLNKIWPWRNVTLFMNKESGEIQNFSTIEMYKSLDAGQIKIITEVNVWPQDYLMDSAKLTATVLAFIGGLILVYFFERSNKST